MKNKLLLPIAALLLAASFAGCSDSGRINQKYMGLNGDIESVKDTEYSPGMESGKIVRGDVEDSIVYTFGSDGKMTGRKVYDAAGVLLIEMENLFEKGKMVAGVTRNYLLGQPIVSESSLVKRSKRGELWEIKVDPYVNYQNIEFLDRGAHVISILEDSDKEFLQKTEERYDNDGNMTEYKSFGKNGLMFWYKYFYDENGRMIRSMGFPDEEGDEEYADITTYKYTDEDSRGNWTGMITYDENGAPISVTVREIVYR